MDENYNIIMSLNAQKDLKSIVMYIYNYLKEPNIAIKYLKRIEKEIESLSTFPRRFVIIDDFNTRRLIIDNYFVFYEINECDKIVYIKRILYGGRNYLDKGVL